MRKISRCNINIMELQFILSNNWCYDDSICNSFFPKWWCYDDKYLQFVLSRKWCYEDQYFTPEELSPSWFELIVLLCPRSNSKIKIDVFARIWLVALPTFESRPIDCWPASLQTWIKTLTISCWTSFVINSNLNLQIESWRAFSY